jgi:acetyltransferase-like isoleucine patch superfamily enzyme
MQQVRLIGANADVVIGADGLFSDEVLVQSHDQHPLVDVATGELLNDHRRHVTLGRHVWVGRRATLMPDVTLGDGCVVGAGAVVSRDVPPECVAAGVPARVVREGVTWVRSMAEIPAWRRSRGFPA